MTTQLVKLAVTEHPKFQEQAPERFDWDLVINHREKDIAGMIAAEIVTRRDAWLKQGKPGADPLIRGLQGALRLIAERAIWKHTQVIVASSAEEETGDDHLRGSQRPETRVPVPAERTAGVRYSRRGAQVPVARSAGSRQASVRNGPRFIGSSLGA